MDKAQENIKNLITNNNCLILATSHQDQAHSSYACFAFDEKEKSFYILVANISRHTKNIKLNPNLSGMLIADESKSKMPWFRKRIHYDLKGEIIKNPSAKTIELLQKKLGLAVLQFLKMNFNVVKLKIIKGLMIIGPGQGFEIDKENNISKDLMKERQKQHLQKTKNA